MLKKIYDLKIIGTGLAVLYATSLLVFMRFAGVTELPERDTDLLRFARHYRRRNSHIEFNTSLILKASGATLENSILLLPLRAAVLEGLLRQAGFSTVRLFADFADAPWSPGGYLTVALARA